MVQVDWHAYALSMHKQNSLRITKGNNSHRIGPKPFFSIINVYLEDISVFARFDEIPSLPVENIKKKKMSRIDGKMDRLTDNVKTVYPPTPHPHKHSLRGYNYHGYGVQAEMLV